ncbi:hypothetical protein N2603_42485 [Bradyrhizobium huanghuaihaiense]|uniref:hypothetical protein n=1 Tax=Bradyrhizobium huanghuaihaiense TaxID=990078 RepID=UPI0021AA6E1E|nr:hypothetical protein [Bradyrhizobium sp. CB3035]UWU76472.1 hypothetical protein N2603_42485 [Bradyrhizobium sp. CB3035]
MSDAGPFSSALRLFLSVDIVGSTAFKQAAKDRQLDKSTRDGIDPPPAEPWFSPIAQFYRGIERTFAKEWAVCVDLSNEVGWPTGRPPELWKSVGDELIYTKLLNDHREALTTLNAWIKTVASYRVRLKEQFKSLDLKTTAWIAGFPVHNAEVIFRSSVQGLREAEDEDDDEVYSNLSLLSEYYKQQPNANLTRDFIGPAIDTGFRLSQLSTTRRLVISVELAFILVHAVRTQPHEYKYDTARFFFEGRHALKGVFGGLPYPVFWIDMRPSQKLEETEDALNGKLPLNTDAVLAFCQEFIKENGAYCFTPYIVGNPDPAFNRIPDHHQERLSGLKAYWEKEAQKREDEKRSGLEKAEPDHDEQKQHALSKVLRELEERAHAPAATASPESTSEHGKGT